MHPERSRFGRVLPQDISEVLREVCRRHALSVTRSRQHPCEKSK